MEPEFSVPENVLAAYGLEHALIERLTGGRTNRTMRARAGRDLVLQHMHGGSHIDLVGVMENLVRVTSHLDWKRSVERRTQTWYPLLVPTGDGKPYVMTSEGDVWRAFAHRAGTILRSSQPVDALASAAEIYGRFAAETADLGGPALISVAPGFHDLTVVCDTFFDDFDRADGIARRAIEPLIETVVATRTIVEEASRRDGLDTSPDRVVHNDTKLSNVLFDAERKTAIAVLDLDLAMMGPSWHDVGDLIRSCAWHQPAGTRSPELPVDLFAAVVGAFVGAARDTLTSEEIATYAIAGPRISFELGVRYLNDHLRAEPHLTVSGPDGHLRRGLANLKLAQEMFGAYDALRPIVDGLAADR